VTKIQNENSIKPETKEKINQGIETMAINSGKILAYGTYLFPSFFIGTAEEFKNILQVINEWENRKIQDRYRQNFKNTETERLDPSQLLKKIYQFEYFNYLIVFQKNGLICITNKEKDIEKEVAIEKLKEILAVFSYFLSVPFHFIDGEILKIYLSQNLTVKSMLRRTDTPLSKLQMKQFHLDKEYNFNNYISPDNIKDLLKKAEILNNDQNINQFLYFFLKASQFEYNYEYSIAFLMSFLIIERYFRQKLNDFLNNTLNNKTFDEQELKKLKSKYRGPNNWKLYQIFETFHLYGILDTETYDTLLELKDIRNQFSHGKLKQQITKEIITKCFQIDKEILASLVEPTLNKY